MKTMNFITWIVLVDLNGSTKALEMNSISWYVAGALIAHSFTCLPAVFTY